MSEREWGSLTAFEATIAKAMAAPEWQALGAEQVKLRLSITLLLSQSIYSKPHSLVK